MEEVWKDVVGYEGLYQVSNLGKVRSLTRIVERSDKTVRLRNGKMLSLIKKSDNYISTTLFRNGKKKTVLVHRLVASAFIPNPNGFQEVNHKDENPSNNHVDNLEWCDRSYNINYGNRNKKCILTSNSNGSKCAEVPVLQYTFDGEFVKRYSSLHEIERTIGKNYISVCYCCSGKYHYSYGYIWIYEKDIDTLDERIKKIKEKRVVQLNLEGKLIKIWNSISEASKHLVILQTSISMCCSGKYKTSGGFKWIKEKDYFKT